MDPTKLTRMKDLLAKAADDRTEAETTELSTLQTEATAAGLNPETGEKAEEGDAPASIEDLKSIITEALKGNDGEKLDADKICQALMKSLEGKFSTLKKEDVEAVVKAAAPAAGLTQAGLDSAIASLRKDITAQAKMQHQVDNTDPMNPSISTERHGNITVAQKQLANIILGGFGDREKIKNLPKDMNDGISASLLQKAENNGQRQVNKMTAAFKAQPFAVGSAGGGAELVETTLSTDLLMRFHMESALARTFLSQEVDMPSNPFKFPVRLARTKFRNKAENTLASGTDAGSTGEVIFVVSTLIGIADWSYEINEDSVIAALPMFQNELAEAAAAAFESALINGDTTATHQDTIFEADAGCVEENFKGFRKLAIAGSQTRAITSISAANLGLLKKDAKRFGHKPSDCVYVVSESVYQDVLELAEAKTVDVAGAAATFLSGQVTRVWGVPVISSAAFMENMNASGVHDGVTTTKSGVLFLNFRQFLIGKRGGFLVETDVDKKKQQYSVIASFRRDLQPKETISDSIPAIQYGYNLTV